MQKEAWTWSCPTTTPGLSNNSGSSSHSRMTAARSRSLALPSADGCGGAKGEKGEGGRGRERKEKREGEATQAVTKWRQR